jgi:hypothetical protein
MIVRGDAESIQLITQPDHAQMAGRIMEHCVALTALARRESVLLAIAEHDNGWTAEDAAPTVNQSSGDVLDFVHLPLGRRHGVWPRGVARLAHDPWAAALVAQHALTVYDRFRVDAEWTSFFEEMAAGRDSMLRASGGPLEDLLAEYPFVRLGDLISLTFCAGWTEPQRYGDWTVRLAGTRVVVTPDPFGEAEIPIEITAREIPKRPYRSDAALRDALSKARARTMRGEVAGA